MCLQFQIQLETLMHNGHESTASEYQYLHSELFKTFSEKLSKLCFGNHQMLTVGLRLFYDYMNTKIEECRVTLSKKESKQPSSVNESKKSEHSSAPHDYENVKKSPAEKSLKTVHFKDQPDIHIIPSVPAAEQLSLFLLPPLPSPPPSPPPQSQPQPQPPLSPSLRLSSPVSLVPQYFKSCFKTK